jgi:hypothetical protein
MIEPLVMDKTNPLCWLLMPQFSERIRQFSQAFTVTGTDNALTWFEACFGSGDHRMLGIALIDRSDERPSVVGHLLAGQETYLGQPVGMVYQFSKDKGKDYLKSDDGEKSPYLLMRQMLEYWCRGHGIQQCYGLVDGAARAKLFGWFGFDDNMRIVRMQLPVHT